MGNTRRGRLWVLGMIAVIAGVAAAAEAPTTSKITISRETTYITGPLNPDGTVNYVAYLDQQASQGVTRDNNAVILLLQALGPDGLPVKTKDRLLHRLELTLPERGDYFISLDKYVESLEKAPSAATAASQDSNAADRDTLDKELSAAWHAPWSAAQHARLASWIEGNAKPLELIVAASKRPRYYMPLVSTDDPPTMVNLLLLGFRNLRGAAKALAARAMKEVADGDIDGAWRDALALHRLARLVSQDPALIPRLVAIAIQGVADSCTIRLAADPALSAARAKAVLADLQSLQPMGSIAEVIDRGERFCFLDGSTVLSLGQKTHLEELGIAEFLDAVLKMDLDWDEILRVGNAWYDEAVAVTRKPIYAERRAAAEMLDKRVEEARSRQNEMLKKAGSMNASGPADRTQLSRMVADYLLSVFVPSFDGAQTVYDRVAMQGELAEVALALAACRAETGAYPASLSALTPKYIPAVPKDRFDEKPLRYRREGQGYVLYSVGPNAKDDGGKVDKDNPEEGDMVVRVPIPPEEGERKAK